MNRWGTIAVAGLLGAAAGAIYNYLFAPAPETRFDGSYRSRLDWALAEGEKAATLRELELRAELEAARRTHPAPLPPSIPTNSPEINLVNNAVNELPDGGNHPALTS